MTSTPAGADAADQAQILAELGEFLRIPSISTLPEHKPDVERAAAWVADYLRAAGLDHVRVIPTAGHPLVYASGSMRPASRPC